MLNEELWKHIKFFEKSQGNKFDWICKEKFQLNIIYYIDPYTTFNGS